MGTTEPLPVLRTLLQRAQISPERFARLLSRCAAELGLVARIDPKHRTSGCGVPIRASRSRAWWRSCSASSSVAGSAWRSLAGG
jgi:hypothetical protein